MAIDDLLDEHEQGERVRSWLRNNAASVLGGILVALALILGWQYWLKHRGSQLAQAGGQYESALASIAANDLDKATKQVATLESGKNGIYASLAALRLAKAQVDAGKNEDAIKTLRAVSAESELGTVAVQRLARLLIDSGKPQDAFKLLEGHDGEIIQEIRGDALVADGKIEQAREAYAHALKTVDVASPQRRLLETKLMDVGGVVHDPAEPI